MAKISVFQISVLTRLSLYQFFNMQNICRTNDIRLKFDGKYSHKTFSLRNLVFILYNTYTGHMLKFES